MAAAPFSSQSPRKSLMNASAKRLRDDFGRPAGLPDCPGLKSQGLCSGTVLSVSSDISADHPIDGADVEAGLVPHWLSVLAKLDQRLGSHLGVAHRTMKVI